ncbi:1,4-alpha-glucan branching protein GlgB [Chitinimonas sp. BJB300]|uniref:1,4-alpha-glucan branching protein GlgB n=1 Tax=Chitinimonas sp. BJB300 TaxID=1559339 RepID=UPI000C0E9205|nr:1,4-alpha-glucan branching protein GlgB [Chitinimonas sp. BJB300]PHV13389.1 1,4-alpha-glucan branching enzyme [Chitinimonas sp. BJB300]TSJ89709.1 1,4-alpha-glucan branching protein GlgB [Chitinimonas sp. BJB300]
MAGIALDPWVVEALCRGEHSDPFAILGWQHDGEYWVLRCWLPQAQSVALLDAKGHWLADLVCLDPRGLFAYPQIAKEPFVYRLKASWLGCTQERDDPYRFPLILTNEEVWHLAEGSHRRLWHSLGAHPRTLDGVAGVTFCVWAPNAKRVSLVGDFNFWDGCCHPMRLRRECGVWEIFMPGLGVGEPYKYEVLEWDGRRIQKADPLAFYAELRPATASIVVDLPVPPEAIQVPQHRSAPVSIYEVHLGSWRKRGFDWLSYKELAETLIPYAVDMGFTHIELLPITEYPFDGSWGYQPTGLYAPTSRFGSPEHFRDFVAAAHQAGLGVILDWVPGHFPEDEHGLGSFDGSHLYEHADPREGFHRDWHTLIYHYGRREVANFLSANALFWLQCYGIDGLRVDAVASMLYRDYSRAAGDWIPNVHGGRENLEAIAFLQQTNHWVGVESPGAITLAEESTTFPGVSRPPEYGGLGFHYKWNMGWMHDTLAYMRHEPIFRRYHQGELSFGLTYAFSENYVLPLSHDEVVHGKGSLLTKMPGDAWQRFANLRALFGFMWAHPGKKLLFMGGEFAQESEWNHDNGLDWHLLDDPRHAGVQKLVRDLNQLYRQTSALHVLDCDPAGFEWVCWDDADNSVFSFIRHDGYGGHVLVMCNFTPLVRDDYRVGVPNAGRWREVLNTDAACYGGSDVGNGDAWAEPISAHSRGQSVRLRLAPLAVQFFIRET